MQYLLDKIAVFFPAYGARFYRLVTDPRRFLLFRLARSRTETRDSFLFYVVSCAIALVILYPALRDKDFWESVAKVAILAGMTLATKSLSLFLALRAVSRRFDFRRCFNCVCHTAGFLFLLTALLSHFGQGVLRLVDPVSAARVLDAISAGEPIPATIAPSFAVTALLLLVAFEGIGIAWSVYAWKAYRLYAGIGRLRSGLAYLLNYALSSALAVLIYLVAMGLADSPSMVRGS